MNCRAADNSQPGALAAMLAIDEAATRTWEPGELAAVLRHQLAAPLGFDVGSMGPASAEEVDRLSAAPGGPIRTFSDLLLHSAPQVELLVLAKDFAKASRSDPGAALPKEIAAVLYFATIVVARRRCGSRISNLSDDELRAGIEWALAQAWIDPATRALFADARYSST